MCIGKHSCEGPSGIVDETCLYLHSYFSLFFFVLFNLFCREVSLLFFFFLLLSCSLLFFLYSYLFSFSHITQFSFFCLSFSSAFLSFPASFHSTFSPVLPLLTLPSFLTSAEEFLHSAQMMSQITPLEVDILFHLTELISESSG